MIFPLFSLGLTASVDRQVLAVGETFTLTVSADKSTENNLNLTSLSKDFELFGTSRSTQIKLINNQMTASTQWSISLYPKRAGHLIIPAFTVAGEKTQPIAVTVSAVSEKPSSKSEQSKHIFFESTVSPHDPYINAQVIYDLKLYYDVAIHNENLASPKLADADMEPVGSPKIYVAHRDGKPFQVFEQRFVFFPKKVGQTLIEPPVLSGMVVDPKEVSSDLDNFILQGMGKPFRLMGEPVALHVQAIPDDPQTAGIAASSLSLKQVGAALPNTLEVGVPYTRTILINATGVKAEQLPAVQWDNPLEGVKIYPDQPQLDNTFNEEGIVGSRTEKIVYIPTKEGLLTLPAVSLSWWNTKEKKLKTATLAAISLTVSGHAKNIEKQPEALTTSIDDIKSTAATAPIPMQTSPVKPSARGLVVALMIALIVIVILIVLLLRQAGYLRYFSFPFRLKKKKIDSEEMVLEQLKKACQENNLDEARQYLLQWMREYSSHKQGFSIENLKDIFEEAAFKEAVDALIQGCYQQDTKRAPWKGRDFWVIFSACVKNAKKPKQDSVKKSAGLPPLNP
jgi:hypothetical protein